MTPGYADLLYSDSCGMAVHSAINLTLQVWDGDKDAREVLDTAELTGGDRVVSAIAEARYAAASIIGKGLADALREIDG